MQLEDDLGLIHPLVVTAYDALGWMKFADDLQRDPHASNSSIAIESLRCSIEWFPRDRQLKQLAKLYDPTKSMKTLKRVFGDGSAISGDWQLETQTYKPRRRYVAKATCRDLSLSLKCYTKDDFRAARRNSLFVRPEAFDDMVPHTIACNERYSTIAMKWLEGATLAEKLSVVPSLLSRCKQAGSLLGHWQKLAQRSCRAVDWKHRAFGVRSLQNIIDDVSWLAPDLGAPLSNLLTRMEDTLRDMELSQDVIHGDFYAKQLIVQGDRLRLIDFDELGLGDRYQDLGNFVGHLVWDSVRSAKEKDRTDLCLELQISAFLEGYECETDCLDEPRLRVSIATGILRCIPHAFRRGLPDWHLKMQQMLDHAWRYLDSSMTRGDRREVSGCLPRLITPDIDERLAYLNNSDMTQQLRQNSENPRRWQHVSIVDSQLIRHRPHRRLLVEYTFQDEVNSSVFHLIGKTRFTKPVEGWLLKLHNDLQSLRPLGIVVPCIEDVLPDLNMWFQEKVFGQNVIESNEPVVHRSVGVALAELHSFQARLGRFHDSERELETLQSQYQKWLMPHPRWQSIAMEVLRLAENVASELASGDKVLLHRDFYFDQVLWFPGGIALLDLDLAAMGPAELDVGNYLAHLEEYGTREPLQRDFCRRACEEFLAGYFSRRPWTCQKNIEIWQALSFARLAAISQRISSRRESTDMLLESCHRRLDGMVNERMQNQESLFDRKAR
jgi:aminoglycoside phosphotransferase (APT) family kinase protein